MTLGSLFAGIGGFDLGFERAGFVTSWQVENDKHCRRVLKTHFPDAERHGDIKDQDHDRLETVDLIAGGFPCQDVSIAGRREGLAGKRSGLWTEFARILRELRPRWVVIENTPGLLSVGEGADFLAVLRGLAGIGYRTAWRVLDAQHFGVPQHRERVFIVGCLGSGAAAEILFERTGLPGDSAPGRASGQGSAWPAENGTRGNRTIPTLRADGPGCGRIGDSRGQDPVIVMPTLRSQSRLSTRGDEGSLPFVIVPTVTAKWAKGSARTEVSLCHRGRVRRLTPLECERLQGFPDQWTNGHSDSRRYKMIGNAVAVPVAEWIAKRIIAVTQT